MSNRRKELSGCSFVLFVQNFVPFVVKKMLSLVCETFGVPSFNPNFNFNFIRKPKTLQFIIHKSQFITIFAF